VIYLLFIPYIAVVVLCSVLYKINKKPVTVTMFMVDLWGLVLITVIFALSFIFYDDHFANFTWEAFGLLTARAVIGVISFIFYLQAIKHLPLAVIKPVQMLRMFPLIFLGEIIWGDVVTLTVLLLAIVVFVSGCLLAIIKGEKKQTTSKQYFIGLAWLLLFVVINIGASLLTRHIGGMGVNVFTFAVAFTLIGLVFEGLILIGTKQNPLRVIKENWNDKIFIGASVDSIWLLFFVPLSLVMNIGLIDAIMVSATALTILASRIFLKEKMRWYSYVLIAIILGCAVTIGILN